MVGWGKPGGERTGHSNGFTDCQRVGGDGFPKGIDKEVAGDKAIFPRAGLDSEIFLTLSEFVIKFFKALVGHSETLARDVGIELLQDCSSVTAVSGFGIDVENGHLLLQRVNIDVVDFGGGGGFAASIDPWDIDVEEEDNVGLFDLFMDCIVDSDVCYFQVNLCHPTTLGITNIDDQQENTYHSR